MYTALVRDHYVEKCRDVTSLLALLAAIQGPDDNEDVAVWHRNRLVAVRHPDGRVTWLQPRPECPAA